MSPPSRPEPVTLTTRSPAQTAAVGEAIGRLARRGEIIALRGPLGAGKTQFVRGLARGLGLDPAAVSSPTFVIVQEYDSPLPRAGVAEGSAQRAPESSPGPAGSSSGPAGAVLVHIDAYRLEGAADLASIGWEGTTQELCEQAVVAVEWADRLGEAIGPDRLEIDLAHAAAGRVLTLTCHGGWIDRASQLAPALRAAVAATPADADSDQPTDPGHEPRPR